MRLLAGSRLRALTAAAATAAVLAVPAVAQARPSSFIGQFHHISLLSGTAPAHGSAAGDQNPYGVAVVPTTVGRLQRGDVLVSNFNNAQNHQGTGSSIVEISRSGRQRVFAVVPQPTATPAVGLTTALVALRNGDVIVGSLPAPGGNSSMMTAGALTILGPTGHVIRTLTAADINGPWDMTADDHGKSVTLYVSNVLNGTVAAAGKTVPGGTVIRIRLRFGHHGPVVLSNRVIGMGFAAHTDPNALVVGPTGLGLGRNGVLYVADSVNNRIAAIAHARTRHTALGGGGSTVARGGALNDPLGLTMAPNGNIVTANGGDGRIVETRPQGGRADVKTLVPNGGGDLFGLAVAPGGSGLYFVNDIGSGPASNSLELLH
jgi:sugar lactone lactonase YvrE